MIDLVWKDTWIIDQRPQPGVKDTRQFQIIIMGMRSPPRSYRTVEAQDMFREPRLSRASSRGRRCGCSLLHGCTGPLFMPIALVSVLCLASLVALAQVLGQRTLSTTSGRSLNLMRLPVTHPTGDVTENITVITSDILLSQFLFWKEQVCAKLHTLRAV